MAEEDEEGMTEDVGEEALEDVGAESGEEGDGGDPFAEEMLKMMEEEGDGGDGGDDLMGGMGNVDKMMEMEMLQAMEEESGGAGGAAEGGAVPPNLARLMDVRLIVTIELGRTRKTIQEVIELGEQSVVELDRNVGEPVNIMVNGKLFARGEVVTVSESFGVRITELIVPVSQL